MREKWWGPDELESRFCLGFSSGQLTGDFVAFHFRVVDTVSLPVSKAESCLSHISWHSGQDQMHQTGKSLPHPLAVIS